MESIYHVIIAGGSGSRFWPSSRENLPKQLLKFLDDKSMIRHTFDRLKKISKTDHILVVCSKKLSINLKIFEFS